MARRHFRMNCSVLSFFSFVWSMSKCFGVTGHKVEVDEHPRAAQHAPLAQGGPGATCTGMDLAAGYGMDGEALGTLSCHCLLPATCMHCMRACMRALVCIAFVFGDQQCFRAGKQSRTESTPFPAQHMVLGCQAWWPATYLGAVRGGLGQRYLTRLASLACCEFSSESHMSHGRFDTHAHADEPACVRPQTACPTALAVDYLPTGMHRAVLEKNHRLSRRCCRIACIYLQPAPSQYIACS